MAFRSIASTDIHISSDSKYSINCLPQWYQNWQTSSWCTVKDKPVENEELIQSILALMREKRVQFSHVHSYSGFSQNEMADTLANMGRTNFNK